MLRQDESEELATMSALLSVLGSSAQTLFHCLLASHGLKYYKPGIFRVKSDCTLSKVAPGRGQEPITPAGVVFILLLFRFLAGAELCASLGGSGDVLFWEALLVSLPVSHSDSAR